MSLLISIFLAGFVLNLLYEVWHSILYKTCLEASWKKYIYLMLKAAIFDGLMIALIYVGTYLLSKNVNPLDNPYQILVFALSSLGFAYVWELHSLKKGKWEYSGKMPIVLGVGVTPFIQLALTGLLTICIIFYKI